MRDGIIILAVKSLSFNVLNKMLPLKTRGSIFHNALIISSLPASLRERPAASLRDRDVTQLLLPRFGNWVKEGEKAGAGGDVSWMEVRGTLTMHKEN